MRKLKLEKVRSFAEVPLSETLEWLWVESDFGIQLNCADLPSLPNLKVLCLPNDTLEEVGDLPELPELTWLWVDGYEDEYDGKGERRNFDWFKNKFPKLQFLIDEYDSFPAEKIAQHLKCQGEIAYLPFSEMKRRTGMKQYSLSVEELHTTPKPIKLHQWGDEMYADILYRFIKTDGENPHHPNWKPRARLLYTKDSLYLAFRIFEARTGLYDDDPVEYTASPDWAGWKIKLTCEDFWDTDGTFLKDGLFQFDYGDRYPLYDLGREKV